MIFDPPITDADVRSVGALASDSFQTHIATAQIIIDENLEGKGLSENRLRLIATYLAAHFAFLVEGQIKAEKIGDSSTTFNIESGQAFASTAQGQQAIALDTTGTLALMNRTAEGKTRTTKPKISII